MTHVLHFDLGFVPTPPRRPVLLAIDHHAGTLRRYQSTRGGGFSVSVWKADGQAWTPMGSFEDRAMLERIRTKGDVN